MKVILRICEYHCQLYTLQPLWRGERSESAAQQQSHSSCGFKDISEGKKKTFWHRGASSASLVEGHYQCLCVRLSVNVSVNACENMCAHISLHVCVLKYDVNIIK